MLIDIVSPQKGTRNYLVNDSNWTGTIELPTWTINVTNPTTFSCELFADLRLFAMIRSTYPFIYSVRELMLTRFGPAPVSTTVITGFTLGH